MRMGSFFACPQSGLFTQVLFLYLLCIHVVVNLGSSGEVTYKDVGFRRRKFTLRVEGEGPSGTIVNTVTFRVGM